MYHDEFGSRKFGSPSGAEEVVGRLAIEVGGGVSAAVAATIALPDLPLLLSIGGLLPWLACCLGILVGRCSEAGRAFLDALDTVLPGHPVATGPAIGNRPVLAFRAARSRSLTSQASRAGFDRSRRLG